MEGGEEVDENHGVALSLIDSLKAKVAGDRATLIKKKMEVNKEKLRGITDHVYNLSKQRGHSTTTGNFLQTRQEEAICTLKGLDVENGENDKISGHEDSSHASSAVLLGTNFGAKNAVRPIKLPQVQKLPPYTTWIFLDRNQRMTEDQSVVGRRRIYYGQTGGEALICSDSEEEIIDEEDEKKDFGESEDYILWMTIRTMGLSDSVLDLLSTSLERKSCDIKARYDSLLKKENTEMNGNTHGSVEDAFADKDLDAALDSFDNLFCRRCLVFDCRLHGCSQDLVFPVEKQHPWNYVDDEKSLPCSAECYRLAFKSENTATATLSAPDVNTSKLFASSGSHGGQVSPRKKMTASLRRQKLDQTESASSNAKVRSESTESDSKPSDSTSPSKVKHIQKRCKERNKRDTEKVHVNLQKRQKKTTISDSDSVVSGSHLWAKDMKLRSNLRKGSEDGSSSSQRKALKSPVTRNSRRKEPVVHHTCNSGSNEIEVTVNDMVKDSSVACDQVPSKEFDKDTASTNNQINHMRAWTNIEKSLFAKGVEIFGRNSCLITRNILSGMKTCTEVSQYMFYAESMAAVGTGDGANVQVEGGSNMDFTDAMGHAVRTRSRYVRRRGRVRRLKYTWKSAGYHSIRKRMTEKGDQPCKQYTPCSCQSACSKQCSCLLSGTCCEKYCGCPKTCKNRFRGCHCAKSQCRSRQCPCFAAGRECDPDVCRNCWVGCGDGTLGGPSQRGDNYECRNMKLLLKQQQRVLLGRSDVSGWGAFIKNSVNKHEYLGEYTGEIISHREADKRGKIYDRENSSFLFNLNDQFVLDAYRKGDKLKFANHSPDPNCYAKVILVAGDHRVGIFAKERINAGEELFYDYRYDADRAPAWAKKPEVQSSKRDETQPSSGRAKKLA